jgi:hypothetical protein
MEMTPLLIGFRRYTHNADKRKQQLGKQLLLLFKMRLSADSPTRPLKSSLSYRSRIPRSSAATMINVYRPSHVDLPSWIPLQSVSFSWQKEGHPMKLQVSSGKTQRLQGSSYSFGSSSDKEYNL